MVKHERVCKTTLLLACFNRLIEISPGMNPRATLAATLHR
jgi:hypothetical protein